MSESFVDEAEVVENDEVVMAPEKPRDDLQDTFEGWVEAEISEDDMIESLHTDHELSYPQAVNRLRKLKSAAGLTRPKGHKSEEVQAFITECNDAGDDRATIIGKLVEKFGYTKNSAASTFSVQGGKLGLAGGGSFGAGAKRPLSEVVEFARRNADAKRADFVKAMVEELEYTESTSGAFYTYMGFAKEYAKQEIEAANEGAKAA